MPATPCALNTSHSTLCRYDDPHDPELIRIFPQGFEPKERRILGGLPMHTHAYFSKKEGVRTPCFLHTVAVPDNQMLSTMPGGRRACTERHRSSEHIGVCSQDRRAVRRQHNTVFSGQGTGLHQRSCCQRKAASLH